MPTATTLRCGIYAFSVLVPWRGCACACYAPKSVITNKQDSCCRLGSHPIPHSSCSPLCSFTMVPGFTAVRICVHTRPHTHALFPTHISPPKKQRRPPSPRPLPEIQHRCAATSERPRHLHQIHHASGYVMERSEASEREVGRKVVLIASFVCVSLCRLHSPNCFFHL